MKSLLLYALILSSLLALAPAQAAQMCEPSDALPEGQKAPVELFYDGLMEFNSAVIKLHDQHFNKTDAIPNLRNRLQVLRNQILGLGAALSEALPELTPNMAQNAASNYLQAASLIGAMEIQAAGSSQLFQRNYLLALPALQYYRVSPTIANNFPAEVNFQNGIALIQVNAASQYSSHLTATARIQLPDRNKQYFESIRCMMGKVLIEKAAAYAGFVYEEPSTDLSHFEACNGFPMQKLVENANNVKADENFSKATTLFRIGNHLSQDDVGYFNAVREQYGINSLEQLIRTAALEVLDSQSELKNVDSKMQEVETAILSENPLMAEILNAALAAKPAIEEGLKSCNENNEGLKYYDKYLTRSFVAEFNKVFPFLQSFGLGKNLALKDTDIAANLTVLLTDFATEAYGVELTAEGEQDFEQFALATYNQLTPKVTNAIYKALQDNGTAAKIIKALEEADAEKKSLIDLAPAIVDYSGILHDYLHENDRANLPFKAEAIGKLFANDINNIAAPFDYHLRQIVTRKTHEARVATWQRAKIFIEKDQQDHGYQCIKTHWTSDFRNGVAHFFGTSGPKNHARQAACFTLKRIALHYGLDSQEEPRSLADIWPSFENQEAYDNGDRKTYEANYRKYLANDILDTYRILDIELSKLNVDSTTRSRLGLGDFEDEDKVYHYMMSEDQSRQNKEDVAELAMNYSRSQLEIDLLVVSTAKTLEELHAYIGNTIFLDQILDAQGFSHYLPGAMARSLDPEESIHHPMWPSLYQHHVDYRRELNRSQALENAMNKILISKLNMPILFLGGAWVTKAVFLRVPGLRGIGAAMQTASHSSRMAIGGYLNFLTWVFVGGFFQANNLRMDINQNLQKINQMKYADAIVQEWDVPLISYDNFLTKEYSLNADKDDAIFDMWLFGGFTVFSAVSTVVGPYLSSRTTARGMNGSEPWRITKWWNSLEAVKKWTVHQARVDRHRLSWSLRQLGNPKSFDLSTLQAARTTSLSKYADEAYHRIVFHMGQRVNKSIGFPEREAALAKELFGSSSRTQGLIEISTEYARLFPDIVRGF